MTALQTFGTGLDRIVPSSSAASAQDAFQELTDTIYTVAREVTVRASETLPGLAESFTDRVLLVVGGHARGPLGHFAGDKWRREAHRFHELHVNVGHLAYALATEAAHAEDVLDTIAHELAHFYARENDIQDTSGRGVNHGRYHNKKFAMLASALGLRVMNSGKSHIGYTTTGLTGRGRTLYGDLLLDVQRALRLTAVPELRQQESSPVQAAASTSVAQPATLHKPSKYVFAQCACRDARGRRRTVRMARGWWEPGTVACDLCRELFAETLPPTAEPQMKGRAS